MRFQCLTCEAVKKDGSDVLSIEDILDLPCEHDEGNDLACTACGILTEINQIINELRGIKKV